MGLGFSLISSIRKKDGDQTSKLLSYVGSLWQNLIELGSNLSVKGSLMGEKVGELLNF